MNRRPTHLAPLFIIGSPRSGTTMLAGLLKRTPWGDAFETHFIVKYYRRLQQFGELSDPGAFQRLAERILSERPILQRKLSVTPQALYDSVESHDYGSLVDAIGLASARQQGHVSWGDKTPHYITDVDVLHSLFPRSKMLYLVRDGRDVAMSLVERSWGPATIYTCATQWRHENEARPILASLKSQGLLHDVRYEDLLASPRETLRGIMAFLEQDFPDTVLNEIAGPIRSNNSGKWQQKMSPRDIEIFEREAGETLRRFNYPVSHDPRSISPVAALRYTAQDRLKHWRNLFVMNVVDTIRIKFLGKEPFAE